MFCLNVNLAGVKRFCRLDGLADKEPRAALDLFVDPGDVLTDYPKADHQCTSNDQQQKYNRRKTANCMPDHENVKRLSSEDQGKKHKKAARDGHDLER